MTSYRPQDLIRSCRNSRKMVLVIVFIALFLDNMLLTVVVPIVPNFLRKIDQAEQEKSHMNDTRIASTTQVPEIVLDCVNHTEVIPNDFFPPPLNDNNNNNNNNNNTTGSDSSSSRQAQPWTTTYQICHNETQWRNISLGDDGRPITYEGSANNIEVGILFASKAIMQLIVNPFIGPVTNRIGYTIPMFTGFIIMMISTIIFAFGETYAVLFVARTVQGIGSSCSSVAGLGMVATFYPDDRERGDAMGNALSGLALGVLVGPPFGGFMYEFAGKAAPFLFLAALAFLDGCLQLMTLELAVKPESQEGSTFKKLLKDPYILIAAGSITFGNMGIAMLEPSLPIWMYGTMHAPEWEQGIAFLPASISYLIGIKVFGPLSYKMGRWLCTLVGMVIIGICCFTLPFAKNIGHLIAPTFGIGFSLGMVDSSMLPHMAYLVDLRHVSVYGSIYAIADVAFCLGFTIGPALSGTLVHQFNFKTMMWIIACVNIIYAPLMWFLRNPPAKEEKMSLIMNDQCPVQYVTYNQNEHSPQSEYDDY